MKVYVKHYLNIPIQQTHEDKCYDVKYFTIMTIMNNDGLKH